LHERLDYKQSPKYLKRLNECHFERSREIFNEAPEDFSTSLEMTQPICETASIKRFLLEEKRTALPAVLGYSLLESQRGSQRSRGV